MNGLVERRDAAPPDAAEARVLRSVHAGVARTLATSRTRSSTCSRTGRTSRDRLRDIRELENEGDRLTREVINLLNRTFVTPLDRDDMYRLASAIDDICDYIDEAADNIDAYEVREVPRRAQDQAEVIHRAAARLHEAVGLLEGFRDSRSSWSRSASSRTRATG